MYKNLNKFWAFMLSVCVLGSTCMGVAKADDSDVNVSSVSQNIETTVSTQESPEPKSAENDTSTSNETLKHQKEIKQSKSSKIDDAKIWLNDKFVFLQNIYKNITALIAANPCRSALSLFAACSLLAQRSSNRIIKTFFNDYKNKEYQLPVDKDIITSTMRNSLWCTIYMFAVGFILMPN